jgi:hypothetical protein
MIYLSLAKSLAISATKGDHKQVKRGKKLILPPF